MREAPFPCPRRPARLGPAMAEALLEIRDLGVDFRMPGRVFRAVDQASFSIEKGQTLALVGESGSGKSVTALSVLGLLPHPVASHPAGSSIRFGGTELCGAARQTLETVRGARIGMIFQEPMTALNPLHPISRQIGEMLTIHQRMDRAAAEQRVKELLSLVGLESLHERLDALPHELSGGQRQRVMIAMALANTPDLLIADEPTTALDVTVQAQILALMQDLRQKLGMAILLITHDLSIVEKMADRVCVMQAGKIVEQGEKNAVFSKPQHPYTQMLLSSRPRGQARPADPAARAVIEARDVGVRFARGRTLLGKPKSWTIAVDSVGFTLRAGHTLGIVGESGSGKTTLGLALLRLVRAGGVEGAVRFGETDISTLSPRALRPYRARMQIVFQDPFGALSPRMSVASIIGEGLAVHRRDLSATQRDEVVVQALRDVHMDPDTRHRYPHEFSGGQRQRIAIARALVLNPEFLVLDEPTSALDISIQAQIVDLLREIQEKRDMAYLFISHDLRVVRAMAHDVMVMKDGKIVESGPAAQIFETPQHPYTRTLLDAALNLNLSKAS